MCVYFLNSETRYYQMYVKLLTECVVGFDIGKKWLRLYHKKIDRQKDDKLTFATTMNYAFGAAWTRNWLVCCHRNKKKLLV